MRLHDTQLRQPHLNGRVLRGARQKAMAYSEALRYRGRALTLKKSDYVSESRSQAEATHVRRCHRKRCGYALGFGQGIAAMVFLMAMPRASAFVPAVTSPRGMSPPGWHAASSVASAPRVARPRRHRRSCAGADTTMEADHSIDIEGAGASILKVTVGGREKPSPTSDFAPLRVDYMERFSAAGMTSGGYNKRDGRASDKETLVSRLMDRPLRPAMHPGWLHETQLLSWVLSFDNTYSPVPLAITAASAALALSNVPLQRAIAGVTVGMDDEGTLMVNPTMDLAALSPLNLTIAGTAEGVLMIEGESDFVSEEDMMRAIEVGHAAVKDLCIGIEEWSKVAGKEKKTDTLRMPPEGLYEALSDAFRDKVDEALFGETDSKGEQSSAMSELTSAVKEAFVVRDGEDPGDGRFEESDVVAALKKLNSARLRSVVREKGVRCDGRRVDEVRPISIETSLLPRTHGSCLFTRGDTQAVATVTLGGSGDSQKTDGITGMITKNFYLQYTFPPSCVGETGRANGPPGRREVGHGALAEKALSYTVPHVRVFPYTIRVESLITESCGSSSMASVCGGSLAMMDAGIPVSSPIAGVAMGLLLDEEGGSGEDAVVLTDILGLEDALGTMDFKVAGNDKGITTFQLDIKCAGLTTELLGRALKQAKSGRLHILEEMRKALPGGPRESISQYVPAALVLHIDVDQIGKVIGPGGKTIRQIIEDFELDGLDVEDDGRVMISSYNSTRAENAKKYVEEMLSDIPLRRGGGNGNGPKGAGRAPPPDFNATELIGKAYRDCEVKAVHAFGCFVEFMPGVEGLVHVSELDVGRVVTAAGFLADKPKLDVKVIGLNEKGKLRLSRRAIILDDRAKGSGSDGASGAAGGRVGNGNARAAGAEGANRAPPPPPPGASSSGAATGAEKEAVPLVALVDAPAARGRGGDAAKGG